MANANIKISQLPNIGSNLNSNTLLPVVSTNGTFLTDKVTVGNLANFILDEAGNTLANAFVASIAYGVANAAQPNITSVGNLTGLTVTNLANLHIPGGDNGYVLQTNGNGNLSWTAMSGSGNGNPGGSNGQVQFNDNGIFGGEGNFTYDAGNHILNVTRANVSYLTAYNTVDGGNLVVANNIQANYFAGDGSNISNVSVDAANVVGLGNISTVNLDGNSSNMLYGNGTFAAPPIGNFDFNGTHIEIKPGSPEDQILISPSASEGAYAFIRIPNNQNADTLETQLHNENGNVEIIAGTPGGLYAWYFKNDGTFTNPNSVVVSSNVTAQYFKGDGSELSNLPVANITGLGNIATANFDGNASNILYGNGEFAGAPISGVSELVNGDNSFVLDGDGNVVFEGLVAGQGVNRGLVWDYGANANGVNSEVRQDVSGVTVRAWTEQGGGVSGYSAPVNIVTNQDANEKQWVFDGDGNLTLPGNLRMPSGNIVSDALTPSFNSAITGITTGNPTVVVTLADGVFGDPVQGQVTISGVTGTTEANDTWYYEAVEENQFQLYTDNTFTTPVDGTTWTTYISGGNAISTGSYSDLSIQGGNVSINSNSSIWEFGGDGNLTTPSNLVIGSNGLGGSSLYQYDAPLQVIGEGANSTMIMGWAANTNSPENIAVIGFNTPYPNGASNLILAVGNNATTVNYWNFDNTGALTLPGNGYIVNPVNSSLDPLNPNVSTMVLTPDANYSYQALVLDPTAPGHIHLRAPSQSGNIDEPNANLFLGGELSGFEVGASYGIAPNVFARSNNYTWAFNNDSNLAIPGNINFSGDPSAAPSLNDFFSVTSAVDFSIVTDSANTDKTWTFGSTGNLTLPGNTFSVNYANGAQVSLGGNPAGNNNEIQFNSNGEFSASGNFTFTDTVGGGTIEIGNELNLFGNGTIGTTGGNLLLQPAGNIVMQVSSSNLVFDMAGNLILPGNTLSINYNNGAAAFGNIVGVNKDGNASNVLYGNGVFAALTGATSSNIANGNSNVSIATANGNVTIAAVGNTTMTVTGTGANIAGYANVTGNVTTGNVVFAANTGQVAFNTGAYISGNANSLSRDGSILLSPYTGAGSNFAGVIVGGSGRLLAPNGGVFQIFNSADVTFQVATKVTVGTAATSPTAAAVIVTGGIGASGTANTGVGALLTGPTFTPLPNTIVGFNSNVNNYVQVTLQNKSNGADATADYILTADNGSDTVNYLDLGIINSGYDANTPTNSLGNIVYAADGYLYAQGNTSNSSQSGGNLVIGTTVSGKNVKIFAGGVNNSSIIANIGNTGVNVTGNINATGTVTANNFSGNITLTGNVTGTSPNVTLVAGSFSYTFDNTGTLTLPAGGGNEGGEIDFTKSPNSSLSGNTVVIDQYIDKIRFFESGGTTRGAYIDLTQATAGVGYNLINRASTIAGSNTAVTLDNIQARVGGSPIRLYINTVSGNLTGAGDSQTMTSGSMAVGSWINVPIGQGAGNAFAMSGALTNNGDTVILNLIDQGSGTGMWRITGMIANTSANLYGVSIERLV